MAPTNLVLLNRRFDDTTPTASSFSVLNNNTTTTTERQDRDGDTPTAHGFTDYDEGDILDELIQETPRISASPSRIATVTALSTEALQSRDPCLPMSVPSSPSTCSSNTALENEFDHDDAASVTSNTSMSVSGRSVSMSSGRSSCIAPSSAASPKMPPVAVAAMASTGGRRRRRRGNRCAGVPASDAGSESVPLPERERGKGQHAKQRARASTQPQAEKTTPLMEEGSNSNKQTAKKSKKTKSAAVTAARRSRHPRLQIGLDLDVELQLKSKVRGDICLTLVLEETQKVVPRSSPEIRRNADGQYVAYDDWEDIEAEDEKERKSLGNVAEDGRADTETEEIEVTRVVRTKKGQKEPRPGAAGVERRELCHLRVGRLNLTRRWWMDGYEMISRFPPPVVAGVAMTMPVAGFAVGYVAAQWAGFW
ncbi:U1 snRNP protein [Sporothrix eucalyptigena]